MQNGCLNLQERGQRSKGLLTVKYHSPQLISFIATVNNISSELKISPVILRTALKMFQAGTFLLKSPCVVSICLINPCHASGELHSTVQGTCFSSFEKHGGIFSVGRKWSLDGRVHS